MNLSELGKLLGPVRDVWWAVFGVPLSEGLRFLYHALSSVPLLETIGAYGIAIILLTIAIKTVLFPLYHYQLSVSRKSMQEQRKIAPQMAELRKKYKGDQAKQQAAMMELYKEHGINPFGGLAGCLPAILQLPILTALYWTFYGNARQHTYQLDHFLWIPHLNDFPNAHPLMHGLPIPNLTYLVIPLLAAATTFVQSRMMQQPPNPLATEQEQQAQQMNQTMQYVMPLMIAYFAFVTPAGLGLYWFVSNCFAIVQQYFVNGWGGLIGYPAPAAATASAGGGPRGGSAVPPVSKPRPNGAAPRAGSKSGGSKSRRARR